MPSDPIAALEASVEAAAASVHDSHPEGAGPRLERPSRAEFGDYSSNVAMLLAPALGASPRTLAERLADLLKRDLGPSLEGVDVAGPGFLNLSMSDAWYRHAVAELTAAGETLGRPSSELEPERILVEFVSANPTGPLTAAGGRHAAYGDSVSRLLAFMGHTVAREYYVNDVGGQTERFARSIAASIRGESAPEDGYEGSYVAEIGERLAAEGVQPDELDQLGRRGTELMRGEAEATLRRYGVEFDTWSSERALRDRGDLERALRDLRDSGWLYEREGATWLRSSALGDDKDRVLVRSEGGPTYYLADIAYHRDKFERGADRAIDVLGADHHGYTPRLRAGIEALGLDPDRLEIAIMQLVHVVEGGERAQMSKRKGEFVTLNELLDDIGADATRFFMLQRSHETSVDLDLELARRTSNDNPVYYVQYAHARTASILRNAGDAAVAAALGGGGPEPDRALEPSERALVRRLLELPSEISEAAARRAPHRLCAFATATAADLHAFYRDCRVVGAEGEGVESERIRLCVLTARTIARTLELLGISAPERM